MSIKRKLQEFMDEYVIFAESEKIMDELYILLQAKKIKINFENKKIINVTANPFEKINKTKKTKETMTYESYILFDNPIITPIYRRKLDYTYSYYYIKQKMLNHLEMIETINIEIIKSKFNQINAYVQLTLLNNVYIENIIYDFLDNKKEYYDNLFKNFNVFQNITLYKSKIKNIDEKMIKSTIEYYHKYLQHKFLTL